MIKEGSKECFGELANKFDECMLNKKEILHKYHVFSLSQNYYQVPNNYQKPGSPKYFVFDTNDREIYSVEWDVSDRCDINRIFFYTILHR